MQRRSQLPRASAAAPATPIPKTSCKKRAISIEVQCKVNFRNGPSRAQSAVQNVTISRQRYWQLNDSSPKKNEQETEEGTAKKPVLGLKICGLKGSTATSTTMANQFGKYRTI